jgi:hypothetical protein
MHGASVCRVPGILTSGGEFVEAHAMTGRGRRSLSSVSLSLVIAPSVLCVRHGDIDSATLMLALCHVHIAFCIGAHLDIDLRCRRLLSAVPAGFATSFDRTIGESRGAGR